MKVLKLIVSFFIVNVIYPQNYTSFFTGNSNDASTNPMFGICLMGGASENDNAMQWFLNLADGGDVVVLRTSGSDGYNDYMFNQLGVTINSVETLRIDQPDGAIDPYVLQKVSQAEAIWFAGGDQADYVNYFKDNALGALINDHINIKQYPIGGISAGMAIMGEYYFDAINGTVTSTEALNNPFDNAVSLGVSDFLDNPHLENLITDTHYDNPDRKGRHMVFLARLLALTGERVYGIGLEEFTAVCIDENGMAKIFGDFPSFDDYAYFIQVNCLQDVSPENLNTNQPLDWYLNQEAVKAYKVPGTSSGSNQFNLNTWENGIGGEWQNWWIDQGTFQSQTSVAVDCENLSINNFSNVQISLYPNPANEFLCIKSKKRILNLKLINLSGKVIKDIEMKTHDISKCFEVDIKKLNKGLYFVRIQNEDSQITTKKLIFN